MGTLQKKVTQYGLRSDEVISLQETLFFFFSSSFDPMKIGTVLKCCKSLETRESTGFISALQNSSENHEKI